MIEKRPFTQKGKVYIGFFPKELEVLPFNFKIVGKPGVFEVTEDIASTYEAKSTNIGIRVEIPINEFEPTITELYNIDAWIPSVPPPNELEDAFIERLTIRDIFSIYHGVEESNKPFLNNLIRKYNKK